MHFPHGVWANFKQKHVSFAKSLLFISSRFVWDIRFKSSQKQKYNENMTLWTIFENNDWCDSKYGIYNLLKVDETFNPTHVAEKITQTSIAQLGKPMISESIWLLL